LQQVPCAEVGILLFLISLFFINPSTQTTDSNQKLGSQSVVLLQLAVDSQP